MEFESLRRSESRDEYERDTDKTARAIHSRRRQISRNSWGRYKRRLERRREEYTSSFVLSFFLSRVYEFRSAKRISAGKQNRTRNVSVYEDALSVARMSLSLLVAFVAKKRKGVDCVARSRECRTATLLRRSRCVSFVLTTNVCTQILNWTTF